MSKYNEEKGQLKCSFCGKGQDQVRKLVAGPGVYICDECIELCTEIVDEELGTEEEVEINEIPKPKEICETQIYFGFGISLISTSSSVPSSSTTIQVNKLIDSSHI